MKQAYGDPRGPIKDDGVSCLHEQIGENDDVNDIPRDKFQPCGGCLACLWVDTHYNRHSPYYTTASAVREDLDLL